MLRRSLRIAAREKPVLRDFKYTPLEDADECIRLLRFLSSPKGAPFYAEISQYKLCDAPKYKALSYTWGAPSDTLNEIKMCLWTETSLTRNDPGAFEMALQCTGGEHMAYFQPQRFLVSPGLESAMRGLNAMIGDVFIWIDALCIDQSNDVEKGHQVMHMDRIYRQADFVYIWLGEEAEDSGLAMDLLEEYSTTCGCEVDGEKHSDMLREQFEKRTEKWTSHWRAFGKLIKRPWFSRRWIIQETVFARKKTLFCGSKEGCWVSLICVTWIYHQKDCHDKRGRLHGDCASIFSLKWASEMLRIGEGHSLTLEALLTRFYNSHCTNPKDAIYSVISMASDIDLKDWLPDYSTKSDDLAIFRKAFEHLVHTTQSLDVMCRSTKTVSETATWLPNFGRVYSCDRGHPSCFDFGYRNQSLTTYTRAIWEYPTPVYSASSFTKPKIKFGIDGLSLFASGYLIDRIRRIPPLPGNSQCRSCNIGYFDFRQWMRVACDMHQGSYDSGEILEMFQRSLVGNRALKEVNGERACVQSLPDAWISILKETACFTDSCGCDLFDSVDMKDPCEPILIRRGISIHLYGKTFAVTERSLGVVAQAAHEGDIVCILLGCSVPVILRPSTTGSGFSFVGECYIHGLMEGEHMQVVSATALEPEEIEIR